MALLGLYGAGLTGGIWEPRELQFAELSRRVAVQLLHASNLAVAGADNRIPILRELGSGELPYLSVALGFEGFGLRAWAGRLSLLLWGAAGLVALYLWLSKLWSREVGAYGVVVLATSPCYAAQCHTMLGEIVPMVGICVALAGHSVAVFAPGEAISRAGRWRYWGLGWLGIAAATASRGVLFGAAAPLLSVGLAGAWLSAVSRQGGSEGGGLRRRFAQISLSLGLVTLAAGVTAAWGARGTDMSRVVGVLLSAQAGRASHDYAVGALLHGMYPWSALCLPALGWSIFAGQQPGLGARDRTAAQWATAVAGVLLVTANAALAPWARALPTLAVGPLAALVAIALGAANLSPRRQRAFGLFVAASLVVVAIDFAHIPDKLWLPFGAGEQPVPQGVSRQWGRWLELASAGMALAFAAAWFEAPRRGRLLFAPASSSSWPGRLFRRQNADWALALAILEVALMVLAAAHWFGARYPQSPLGLRLSALAGVFASWAWLAFPLLVLVLPVAMFRARDCLRLLFDETPRIAPSGLVGALLRRAGAWPVARGDVPLLAGALVGLLLISGVLPALSEQSSAAEVLGTFRSEAARGERLALLRVPSEAAIYSAGTATRGFDDPGQAFDWLMAEGKSRRWLAFRALDLPELNYLHRGMSQPKQNLPVVATPSQEILLAATSLPTDESAGNPLAHSILARRPHPAHRVVAQLGDGLRSLGWEVVDSSGQVVESVRAGFGYRLRILWEVLAPTHQQWETFVHIDGHQRRYNGDHVPLGATYPMRYWLAGDFIVDEHPIVLEPNFSPGVYQLYYGLYRGAARMEVVRGESRDNRIIGGAFRVE